jgi:protein disulfide-isomerase-like protein
MSANIAVLALLACAVAAAGVVTLNSENFDEIVMDHSKDVFVKFYAPWCGHCTSMAPAWTQLAATHGDVVIAELDADASRDVAVTHGVSGFPTVKLYTKNDKSGKDFRGARDLKAWTAFLKTHVH